MLGSSLTASISSVLTLDLARGATSALSQKQNAESKMAMPNTGNAIRGIENPAILMDWISLSAESLPNTSMTAARKLNGMVNISENGKTLKMNSITSIADGCLPTNNGRASLNILPSMNTPLSIATANKVVIKMFLAM